MAQQTKTYLKTRFETGDKPTEQDFTDLIDSFGLQTEVDANAAKREYPVDDENKLAGIEANATADLTGAEIKALLFAIADTNNFTDAFVAKINSIENGATGDLTGAEIKTLLFAVGDTNNLTDALLAKLNSIESNATGDQTGAEIKTAYESQPNTNAYTDAEQAKLASIEGSATADQTGAEIKTLYENESNTNAFTDAEKSKLAGIETAATADQEASEIKTILFALADTNNFTDAEQAKLAAIEAGATGDLTAAEIEALLDTYYGGTTWRTGGDGLTSEDRIKLDSIESGATADQTGAEIRALLDAVLATTKWREFPEFLTLTDASTVVCDLNNNQRIFADISKTFLSTTIDFTRLSFNETVEIDLTVHLNGITSTAIELTGNDMSFVGENAAEFLTLPLVGIDGNDGDIFTIHIIATRLTDSNGKRVCKVDIKKSGNIAPAAAPKPSYVQADATFENIGIMVDLSSGGLNQVDTDRDSTFSVLYREQGQTSWKTSLEPRRTWPTLQINGGNANSNFWGASCTGLTENTTYEIRTEYYDPDVGSAVVDIFEVTTKAKPTPGATTIWCTASGSGGTGTELDPYAGAGSLGVAVAAASAGDTIQLADGTYNAVDFGTKSGTLGNEISIVAENRNGAIISSTGEYGVMIGTDAGEGKHIIFDGIKFVVFNSSGSSYGARLKNASFISFLNCDFDIEVTNPDAPQAARGIYASIDGGYDSDIWAYNCNFDCAESWTGTHHNSQGLYLRGNNNVVEYCTMKNVTDGISLIGTTTNQIYSADIHHCDIQYAEDDATEVDGSYSNVRIYENRITNALTGFSAQPQRAGGPYYIWKNLVYQTKDGTGVIKLRSDNAGFVLLQNTIVSFDRVTDQLATDYCSNNFFKNNVFVSYGHVTIDNELIDTGSMDDLDYNAYYSSAANVLTWEGTDYASVSAFNTATSMEANGQEITLASDFESVATPVSGVATVWGDHDFHPSVASGLRGAGVAIAGLGQTSAPDVGAWQYGVAAPTYGCDIVEEITVQDSYTTITAEQTYSLWFENQSHRGQSFETDSNGGTLYDARVRIIRGNTPPGNAYIEIYASTGTHGTNAVPTGSALATSDARLAIGFSDPQEWETFTFSGANQIELDPSTVYICVLKYADATSGNYIDMIGDNVSPTHGGNCCWSYNGTSWTAGTGWDHYFEVRTTSQVAQPPASSGNVSVNNAALTISGDQARVTWEVSTKTTIPSTWKIERQKDGGSWEVLETAYAFTGNQAELSLFSWNTYLPYLYYIDEGLVSSSQYKYRITGGDSTAAETNAVSVIGTTYYVKNGGSDSNTGLSDGQAFATIAKANSVRSAGDLVRFNRGDSWTVSSQINFDGKGSGTAANPIKWDAYGTGNRPRFITNTGWGVRFYNVSHWVWENIRVDSATDTQIRIESTTGQTVQNIKILNCYIDYSKATGIGGAVAAFEAGYSNAKDATSTTKDVEVAYCYITAPTMTGGWKSAVKAYSCSENMHCHNTFLDQVPAGYDCAGGIDHRFEFSVVALKNYGGTINPESSKMHGQQHWAVRPIFRNVLVYDSETYGLALETTEHGLIQGCTTHVKGSGYAGLSNGLFWSTPEHPHRGNLVLDSVSYYDGSWGGSCMINIADSAANDNGENFEGCPPSEWYKTFKSRNNCYYATTDSAVMRYNTVKGTYDHWNTTQEFADNFAAYTENDIMDDPLFTSIAAKDFSLDVPSPCIGKGYENVPSLSLNLLYAYNTDLERNKIFLMYDKDLDESLTDTTLFSVSGGKTVSSVSVNKHIVELTLSSDYTIADTITVSYTAGETNKIKHFNLDAPNLSNVEVENNIFSTYGEELVVNGDLQDGWTGDDPDSWIVYGSQDSDDYVNFNNQTAGNGYTTYNGARLKATSVSQYMRQSILTSTKEYEVKVAVALVNSGSVKITGFGSTPVLSSSGVYTGTLIANSTTFGIETNSLGSDVVIRWVSVREMTPGEPYGSEKLTDGELDQQGNWVLDTGITISGGKAIFDTASNNDLEQTVSGGLATNMRFWYYISSYTSGSPYIWVNGATDGVQYLATTPGLHWIDYDGSGNTDNRFHIYAGGPGVGGKIEFDYFSLKEINPTGPSALMNSDPIFASGIWTTDYMENSNNGSGTIQIITSDKREGSNAVQATCDVFRQELLPNTYTGGFLPGGLLGPQWGRFVHDVEYLVGISIKLVNHPITTSNYGTTLVQSHTNPDNWDHGACCSGDNAWTVGILSGTQSPLGTSTPAFAIHSNVFTTDSALNDIPDCGAFNYNAVGNITTTAGGWHTALSNVNNVWVDIVLNFKNSYTNAGFMKAYVQIDGGGYNQVINNAGPNVTVHASCAGNVREEVCSFTFGPYQGSSGPVPVTSRYDSVRVIDKEQYPNASLDDVKVGGLL